MTDSDYDDGYKIRFDEIDSDFIRRERRRRRWTSVGLAQRARVGEATIHRIEKGKSYRHKNEKARDGAFLVSGVEACTLARIAAAFDRTLVELLLVET